VKGAEALIRTLTAAGIRTCFTNPGTSEMHFVAALDEVPEMRAVLTLFEGVATGAADGYARMAECPAATLLHLGPGLGNGLANLHNARRARVPIVNVVGDHATHHVRHDAPLQSDVETLARNVSAWVRTSERTEDLSRDAAEAIAAALGPPARVATLIIPADLSWSEGAGPGPALSPPPAPETEHGRVSAAAKALEKGERTGLLLGGGALRAQALMHAGRIARRTGARLLAEVFPARVERGAGLPAPERLAYVPEFASIQLRGLRHLVLVDTRAPVTFFAYPGKHSELVPDGCKVHELTSATSEVTGVLAELAAELRADQAEPGLQTAARPQRPTGALTADTVAQAIGATLPEGAIVSDESQTAGVALPVNTAGAPRHDWLALTGGAIGQGLPVAVGAALACPDRPVFALEADGSALYTIQSLWTMAREQLNVTVIILNNSSYAILNLELARVGAKPAGAKARAQLDLGRPEIDFVELGTGLGVASIRVESAEELTIAIERALAEPGPHLIEVRVPSTLTPAQLRAMPHALRALEALPRPVAAAVKNRLYP
jgi:acetolactate synthase-1/2/3 large subunit